MNRTAFATVILAALVSQALPCSARTWFVEKDGSGNFTEIQDAVNAAASGDTIRIGPGRFDEARPYTYPGGDYLIVANVWQEELTLIGAGREQTIIGAAEPPADYLEEPYLYGINDDSNNYGGGRIIRVSDLQVRNQTRGMEFDTYGRALIERCGFDQNWTGVRLYVASTVSGCWFERCKSNAIWATGYTDTVLVADSWFGRLENWGIHFDGVLSGVVRNCVMTTDVVDGVAIGLDNCYGEVSDCTITGYRGGVGIYNPQYPVIRSNTIDVLLMAVHGNAEAFTMEENVLSSQTGPTFFVTTRDLPHTFRTNHILPPRDDLQGRYACKINANYGPAGYRLDMTGNWWGTTDSVEISDMIYDSEDGEIWQSEAYVDFAPVLDTPVPNTESTLGGIKALFR